VELWRGHADEGRFEVYQVPRHANQTVLDVVSWVQRHRAPDLAYRFACRVGMCGSCAMTVNGRPRWTCRTHVARVAGRGVLRIGPLRNATVIRDLVTDMAPFFDKWRDARGRLVSGRSRHDPLARIDPRAKHRVAASQAIECIGCGVCHAACDVVAWRPEYLGPAALNRAWAAYNDLRDDDRAAILDAVSGQRGCHHCHSHQSCAEHCPVALNPTRSIAGLKRASVLGMLPRERRS
jgi:fumarate reductase iron-sulfur subunit